MDHIVITRVTTGSAKWCTEVEVNQGLLDRLMNKFREQYPITSAANFPNISLKDFKAWYTKDEEAPSWWSQLSPVTNKPYQATWESPACFIKTEIDKFMHDQFPDFVDWSGSMSTDRLI